MTHEPKKFAYTSMGTSWEVTIWDDIDPTVFTNLQKNILEQSEIFDQTFSRFKKTSLIWKLTEVRGITEVPADLVRMLRLYETLNRLSGGALNPLIGNTLSDLGYDADYSLKPKDTIRPVPNFASALQIIDDTHINLQESALIDLGALGKGFFVDKIALYLKRQGIRRFLANGSGDVYYSGNGIPLRAGLEHPKDPTKVVGVIELMEGALCASAGSRRAWATYNHTINPTTLTSPDQIIATWVTAKTAALADGLCTCLFMTQPEAYASLDFEYCLLSPAYTIKRSTGFTAELF
jgi:thiamine biosynthesis lipoprotein